MIAPFFLLSPLCLPACLTCQVPAESTPRSAPDRRHRPKATSISKKQTHTSQSPVLQRRSQRQASMRHNVTRAQTSAGTRFAGASPQVPQCHRASLQVIYMQGADSSGRSGTWHRLIRKVRQERAQTYPEGQAHGTNSSGGSGTSAISQRAMAIHVHFFFALKHIPSKSSYWVSPTALVSWGAKPPPTSKAHTLLKRSQNAPHN